MRTILFGVVGTVLAAAAGASAFSQAAQRVSPEIAATVFANGHAEAALAAKSYKADLNSARDPALSPNRSYVDQALAAYASEPLSDDAMFLIVRGTPDVPSGNRLAMLELAHQLTRRSSELSFDLLSGYSEAGSNAKGLKVVDILLRRQTAVHGELLESLARLSQDSANHNDLVMLLRDNPLWASQYWRQLAQSPEGLEGAASLWLRFTSSGGVIDEEMERYLVAGLAGTNRFADAELIAEKSTGRPLAAGRLFQPTFTVDAASVPPFAWTYENTSDFGADVGIGDNGLLVSALPGARGVAASQTVKLGAGRYRAGVGLRAEQSQSGSEHLRLRIVCLQPAAGEPIAESAVTDLPITFSTGSCTWASFEFAVDLPAGEAASEWILEKPYLQPLAGDGS